MYRFEKICSKPISKLKNHSLSNRTDRISVMSKLNVLAFIENEGVSRTPYRAFPRAINFLPRLREAAAMLPYP